MSADPIAELIRNCPPEIVRSVTVQIDADAVTVTQVYDRAAYERYATDCERADAERRRHFSDAFAKPDTAEEANNR
ncbi:hypothetical protein [Tsukamurella tyrosinosolvens]|uniref:hypothetical protein n=1 Tax=Tsukamurella tyrosinosolvens TaxID=57704 RepID=UPI0007B2DA09|nr:hypothetical protein [Tsukamurella tyrosinosolvens]KZL96960.1 hypothetical protein AXX05_15885 [Tsukamurella tyrosinosolvens]